MTAGWCARTVRAAVFAAVCVLLAALGHVLMSGSVVPWWTVAAGFVATSGVGWSLAGRERGLPLVVSVVVLAQGALHSVFSLARSASGTSGTSGVSGADSVAHHHMAGHMAGDASGMSMGMGMGTGHSAHTGHLGPMVHGTGGMSSFGMLAAHALAALLSGLWLAHGERAAFRVLRSVAGWLAAPLRLPVVVLPLPAHRPCRRPVRERAERAPMVPLAHTIISRGPPAGTAVV
ncbi:hypothetical protein ACFFS2_14765 [Streptomyces aurantiacus]|uniref:Integral-membrane protein n=1 Tax=Streptomyces aurantiacus TaxID=47760 RepID=A0A7G1NSU0_9ACTN|nr:hypothetical protein [Streptomyces aurantiacus]BCL25642.1 hypothetical protein GCM10017557_05010 [Streptomyces aurantiacus]